GPPTLPAWIDLDADGAVGSVDQASIRGAAVGRVERDRRQAAVVEGLPFVDAAVAVGVFLCAHGEVLFIVLGAADLPVAPGRNLDALDLSVGTGVGPGVLLAVVRPGKSNFFELLIRAVVLPPIDLPVPVRV